MKKQKYFGYSYHETRPMDFEWPTKEDLLAMPLDKPIRVVALRWHTGDYDTAGNFIGGIQVVLENGCVSPIFRAAG